MICKKFIFINSNKETKMDLAKKMNKYLLAIVFIGTTASTALFAMDPAETRDLKYANFNPNYASNLLHELSEELGFYAYGGIKPEDTVYADQSTLFPALLGGSLHVVAQDTDAVAGAHVAGATDFLVISIYRDKEPWLVAFRGGINVNSVETCSGGGAGGRNEFNAKEIIIRLGGNPDNIEWIPIGGGSDSRVKAFMKGQIDCVQHFDRHRKLVIDAGGKTVYDELEDVPQDGFVVLRSWAEKNPRTVINMLKAFILARDFVHNINNKESVIRFMRSRDYDIPESFVAQYPKALKIIGADGHFSIKAMDQLIVDSVRTGSLVKSIDWRTFIDMSYLNTAYKELGMPERVRNY